MSYSMQIHSHAPRHQIAWSNQESSTAPARTEGLEANRADKHKHKHADDDHRQLDSNDRPGRRNPLVGAMMQALQGLMAAGNSSQASGTTAAPAAADPDDQASTAAITTQPASDAAAQTEGSAKLDKVQKGELKDAAAAFAHELFNALRGGSEDRDVKRQHSGYGHHHGHGHGRGRGDDRVDGGYGNLAQRLQDLAGKLAPAQPQSPAVAEAAVASQPSVVAAVATPEVVSDSPAQSVEPTPVAEVPDSIATSPGVSVSIEINIKFEFSSSPGQAQAASPLLAAFENLLEKLQASPAAGSSDMATSSVDRLREFLLGIANSLQAAGPGGTEQDLRPAAGSLINISA